MRRVRTVLALLAIALVAMMLLPGNVPGSPTAVAEGAPPGAGPAYQNCTGDCVPVNFTTLNLTGNPVSPSSWGSTGSPISSTFWGTTVTPRAKILPGEGTLMNATPTQIILWPGAMAGDFYNPMNGSIYTVHRYYVPTEKRIVTRSYHTWENVTTTEAEFVKWCESIHCASIFQVPGETNNSAMAAWMVNYTENTLGFHPTYWEIGNEPQLWKMYNVSWTKWPIQNSTLPTSKVTPSGYAWLVHNFTVAMRAVDPKIKIIGLPAAGRPDPLPVEDWVAPVVAVDGPDISVIAYHDYPAGNALPGSPTLQNFYAAINGSAGLNGRIAEIRGGIQNGSNPARYPLTTCTAACAANISLFVTEFGTALSHREYGPWSVAFPGALDYAAQVTQAMDLNVSNVDVFGSVFNTTNSWLSLTGAVRPS